MASSSGCAPREGGKSLPDVAGRDGSGSAPSGPEAIAAAAQDKRFPRLYRLTARRQYLSVYDQRRRVSSSSFTLFAAPNDTGWCRLGLTVPKRIGKAVSRNRVKRVLRDVFRTHRITLQPAFDLVVNARDGIATRTHAEIEREFLEAFRRLRRRMAP